MWLIIVYNKWQKKPKAKGNKEIRSTKTRKKNQKTQEPALHSLLQKPKDQNHQQIPEEMEALEEASEQKISNFRYAKDRTLSR